MFLSIDYGQKRIGLASGHLIPQGAGVLDAQGREVVSKIGKIVQDKEATGIVIGLPLRSQGEEGTIAAEIRQFAGKVATELNMPVYFENEQFTSAEASNFLRDQEVKVTRESGKVDEIAAILILEQFLDRLKGSPEIKPDIDPR